MTTIDSLDLAFAAVLADHLAMRGLTAADLATAINVPTSRVENWIADREPIMLPDLARVSVALGVMPSTFIVEATRSATGGAR